MVTNLDDFLGQRIMIRDISSKKTRDRAGVIITDERFRRFCGAPCIISGHSTPKINENDTCYVFIQPLYRGEFNPAQEELAQGKSPHPRIHETNPILEILAGLNSSHIHYKGKIKELKTFDADKEWYSTALYANDGNYLNDNSLVLPLVNAGFSIKRND